VKKWSVSAILVRHTLSTMKLTICSSSACWTFLHVTESIVRCQSSTVRQRDRLQWGRTGACRLQWSSTFLTMKQWRFRLLTIFTLGLSLALVRYWVAQSPHGDPYDSGAIAGGEPTEAASLTSTATDIPSP